MPECLRLKGKVEALRSAVAVQDINATPAKLRRRTKLSSDYTACQDMTANESPNSVRRWRMKTKVTTGSK